MTARPPSKLLVSVRSAGEARAALLGGADLIDVKEPSRGPLGAADPEVIRQVVKTVSGKVPVSAALGEWADWPGEPLPGGLTYAKWGMARQAENDTRPVFDIRMTPWATYPVLVAYADYRRADSPDPEWLAEAAIQFQFPAFLLDTAVKDRSTLLDWVEPAVLARLRFRLGDAGVGVALAGNLDEALIRTLGSLEPDWMAVRGAACVGGRAGIISSERIRFLKGVIAERGRASAG